MGSLARQIAGQSLANKCAHAAQAASEHEAVLRALELEESEKRFARLKRAEAALAESQGLLRAIIDTAPIQIFWKDRDLRYGGCNAAFAAGAGLPPEEIIGKDDYQMRWRDLADQYRDNDRAVLETGQARLFYEESLVRPDGRIGYARISKVPLTGDDSEVIGVLGIYEDITDSKAAEAALEAKNTELQWLNKKLGSEEARLRLVLESAGEAIYGINLQGICTFANRSCLRMLGYDSKIELVGQPVHRMIHHSHANGTPFPVTECPVHRALRAGAQTHCASDVHWRRDGTSFPVEYWSHPMVEDGRTIGAVITFIDISARKADEAELRWLNEAVRQSTAAIVVADMDQRILYANPAYEWLFGYRLAELRGRHMSMLLPDDPDLRKANSLEAGTFEGERLRRTKDGHNITVLVKTAPILDDEATAIGFVSAETDLTHLKEAELRAEAASQAKSDFLANMSHEIRTPMNGIIGLTHLALIADDPERRREYIEGIEQSAHRLLAIINDILDLSKVEARQMQVECAPFDLRRVIGDTVAMVRASAEDKGLSITARIAPALPRELIGDPLRIGQILLNFLNNAVKFTDRGKIEVEVDAETLDGGDLRLRVAVTDTGIGLAPEQQVNLFVPFQQGDSSITRKFGGTGLGLAIAKQLAELMGGDVGVDSTIGRGSTFRFTVRVAPSTGAGKAAPKPDEPASGPPRAARSSDYSILRGTRVLLAEDDPTNQTVAVGLLRAAGMEVDVAGDGVTAVEWAGARPYEIILMDVRMPRMDGVTATRRIRCRTELADLPIIALTANAMRSQEEECLSAGMNDFVGKPFDPGQLYAVIHKWVTGLGEAPLLGPAGTALLGDDVPLPARIEGLDIRAGLRRVAGMRRLYLQALKSFVDQGGVVATMRDSIADRDIERASRLAHTLKGAAGMVEAREIYRLAGDVEAALMSGNLAQGNDLIGRLDAQLTSTLGAVRAVVDGAGPISPDIPTH